MNGMVVAIRMFIGVNSDDSSLQFNAAFMYQRLQTAVHALAGYYGTPKFS